MDDETDIHDRIEKLEATVADQQQTIEQLTETPDVGRRSVVASLLGAGAVGGLAGYGSQSARAQASGPAGQVGTAEEPVDGFLWDLDVQNGVASDLPMGGNDVTGVGALETESLESDDGPDARWTELVDFGGAISDGAYESFAVDEYEAYRLKISITGGFENELRCRINGISSSDYENIWRDGATLSSTIQDHYLLVVRSGGSARASGQWTIPKPGGNWGNISGVGASTTGNVLISGILENTHSLSSIDIGSFGGDADFAANHEYLKIEGRR